MGEKELFHEPSVKVPLIIYNPDTAADCSRGTCCEQLIESIDLVPTFIEFLGGQPKYNILEGKSLIDLLKGNQSPLREFAFSEYDYAMRQAREALNVEVKNARIVMVRDLRYKYTYIQGMRPTLFDLQSDPQEQIDIATDPHSSDICHRFDTALTEWALKHHNRITITDSDIIKHTGREADAGILIGYWDTEDLNKVKQKGRDF